MLAQRRRALVAVALCAPLALRRAAWGGEAFAPGPLARGPPCRALAGPGLAARAAEGSSGVEAAGVDSNLAWEDARAAPAAPEPEETNADPSPAEQYLGQIVGLSPSQLAKVRNFWATRSEEMMPSLMKVAEVAEFLVGQEMGLTREEVQTIIADCPGILEVFSVETLREKVRFLREEARVQDSDLAAVLAAYPQVFDRSVAATLRPSLEFWIGAMGVPPAEMAAVLVKMPAQVWCKPETMRPKWKFAEEVMGLKYQDILDLGTGTPFFRLSLDKTIAPRHFFLRRKNITGLSPQTVLGSSDKKFSTDAAKCKPAEYLQWLSDEWPVSEEARTIAWVKPRSSPRAASGGGGQRRASAGGEGGGQRRSWRGGGGNQRRGGGRRWRGGGQQRGEGRGGKFQGWRERMGREEGVSVGAGDDGYYDDGY